MELHGSLKYEISLPYCFCTSWKKNYEINLSVSSSICLFHSLPYSFIYSYKININWNPNVLQLARSLKCICFHIVIYLTHKKCGKFFKEMVITDA